jgi:hypothetical protein
MRIERTYLLSVVALAVGILASALGFYVHLTAGSRSGTLAVDVLSCTTVIDADLAQRLEATYDGTRLTNLTRLVLRISNRTTRSINALDEIIPLRIQFVDTKLMLEARVLSRPLSGMVGLEAHDSDLLVHFGGLRPGEFVELEVLLEAKSGYRPRIGVAGRLTGVRAIEVNEGPQTEKSRLLVLVRTALIAGLLAMAIPVAVFVIRKMGPFWKGE